MPVKLITGLVILHAERISHGSQEEFAVRLYRRENQARTLSDITKYVLTVTARVAFAKPFRMNRRSSLMACHPFETCLSISI